MNKITKCFSQACYKYNAIAIQVLLKDKWINYLFRSLASLLRQQGPTLKARLREDEKQAKREEYA
jgi:hypothetical protein